ncbi:MAG: hypothetical protein H6538_03050 [Bacteroidales bacterium]|nr:hypothetical protein [Bacteroidales bacterium]
MKRCFLLALILFLNWNSIVFCIGTENPEQLPVYPTYKEAVSLFLSKYSIRDIVYPNQFRFAKKPDGWHAIIFNLQNEDNIKDELFWKRKNVEYQSVNFPKTDDEMLDFIPDDISDDWANNYFTGISPYWGYPGWDKDVIDEYSNKPALSDTLLNALARAYCSFASNLLNNNTGFSLKSLRFKIPDGQNSLSPEQLASYREYEHKGIETYYKLWKTNPEFETFVADAYSIYSNEILNSYLTILYHQNREEARKELKDGLYDPFFIRMAKNILASCDSNAILFVNGDSDTFPLLYVQEKERYRDDVTVINIGLLSTGRYITHLLDGKYTDNPISCKLDREIYSQNLKQVFYIIDKTESISIDSLITLVSSSEPESKIELGGDYYDYIPARNLSFNFHPETSPRFESLYNIDKSEVDTEFNIQLNKKYLFLNQFCFLDIFCSNEFRRPIYFAITVSNTNYLDLDEYFLNEGLAYKIMPYKPRLNPNGSYYGNIDTDIQYKKLMNDLSFQELNTYPHIFEMNKRMIFNYRYVFNLLAQELLEENKRDSALKVLDFSRARLHSENLGYNYFSIPMIEMYYKLGQIALANNMAEEVFNSSKAMIDDSQNEDADTDMATQAIMNLSRITEQYAGETIINKKLQDESDKILQKSEP